MEEGIVPVAHPHVQSPSATHSENVANNTCTLNAGGPINSNGTPVGNENDSTVHTNPTFIPDEFLAGDGNSVMIQGMSQCRSLEGADHVRPYLE